MTRNLFTAQEDLREFVAQQLAREFDGGATLGEAAQKLRAALPAEKHWAVTNIETAFAGGASPRTLPLLGELVRVAREKQASPERAFVAYENATRQFAPGISAALSGATSFGVYLAGLVLLLILVLSVYAMFVLPNFAALYDEFGAPLPGFTTLMLGQTWLLAPLLILALVGIGAFFVGLQRVKRRLLALAPVRPVLRRIPGFARWAAEHDAALWVQYQAILLDAGATPAAAQEGATELAGEPADSHRPQLLASAAQLGRLRDELARQLEKHRLSALEGFERPRNAFVLLMRLIIYLLVGAYVLAMYLPIFKLGAVI